MNDSSEYQDIKQFVDGIRIIDTHEHLPEESERIEQKVDLLATFFPHYASSDLRSAGMSEEDLVTIRNPEISLDERWLIVEPWWEKIRNTAYARCLEIVARDLYEVDGINTETYQELSEKIKQRNKKGLYEWVLKKSSGIDISINNTLDSNVDLVDDIDRTFFRPVRQFNDFLHVRDRDALEQLGKQVGGSIHSFREMVSALESEFIRLQGKIVGVKISLAYTRPIYFEKVSFSEADKAFNEIFKGNRFKVFETPEILKVVPEEIDSSTHQVIQDYLVHKIIREAMRRKLPIQIHTGLHEGNENILSNSNPELLTNLFMEYNEAQFDIFHGGWPYSDELGALAKNFPNVYIDMCWMHIISPTRSQTALSQWLDEVPANKILGFGGDYLFVEGVYGHSVIARENVVKVLVSKVNDGVYSLDQAKKYAQWILRENALQLFFPQGL
ncbi:MAG: amidohydrolase family protein [Candidatus Thorarchaeota archaeon]|jgi:predicted TIM-barrel fold metal-dependent hydrolase